MQLAPNFLFQSPLKKLQNPLIQKIWLSPLPVTGMQIQANAGRSGLLSREGSLLSISCHTYCDTGLQFIWSQKTGTHVPPIELWDVGASLSDETVKTEVPCRSRCGMIKIPPCSKALSAEHGPKFAAQSPVMVTAAGQLKNCSGGYKAISCFFSVLRQFKFVKPTRQPGEKTNKLQKTKLSSHVVWT